MLGGRAVGVNNTDASESSHGGGHVALSNSVHGRGNTRDGEFDVTSEACRERDSIGWEVDVVREKDNVIVSV